MKKIEEMYKFYLTKMQLEKTKMSPVQKVETKRAFYGGIASMFNQLEELVNLPEDDCIKSLEDFKNELSNYWKKQIK